MNYMDDRVFNPDDTTRRDGPPIKKIEARTRFVDTKGKEHDSYADAYKASVHARLTQILWDNQVHGHHYSSAQIASAIMKELTVSWP